MNISVSLCNKCRKKVRELLSFCVSLVSYLIQVFFEVTVFLLLIPASMCVYSILFLIFLFLCAFSSLFTLRSSRFFECSAVWRSFTLLAFYNFVEVLSWDVLLLLKEFPLCLAIIALFSCKNTLFKHSCTCISKLLFKKHKEYSCKQQSRG